MLKIDTHTHILPPRLPDFKERFGYGGFITIEHHASSTARLVRDDGKVFREVQSNCFEPDARISQCNKHKVDIQVLSTVPVMFSYWARPQDGLEIAQYLNDHIAQVVASYPDRFIGLGTLPMQAPKLAIAELERCIKGLGLAGIQIGSHVNDWNLSDEALFPIFEAAADLSAAIFVHPWDMMGEKQMPKYFLPWLVGMPAETTLAICSMIFGGVFEKLPKLRVAFAHGGGAFAGTLGRIEQGFYARPDLCAIDNPSSPRSYLGRFYVDSLVHEPLALKLALEVYGDQHIMLGTDYPFPLGEEEPGKLINSMSDLSEVTRRRLLSQNALAWLGSKTTETLAPRPNKHHSAQKI